jgi:hypothetical protein
MSSNKTTYNQLMNIDSKYLKLYLQYSNMAIDLNTDIDQVDKFKLVELIINRSRNNNETNLNNNNIRRNSMSLCNLSNIDLNERIKRRASLSDLKSIEDIENLNEKQIKQILIGNFVHFTPSSQRTDLVKKLKTLYLSTREINSVNNININIQQQINKNNNTNSQDNCKICMAYEIDCVLLDCGHMISCCKW